MYVPSKVFLTSGIGIHKDKLTSFELALRDAGISPFNLVKVSSIFPPNAKLISREEGLKELKYGQIVHCVMSEISTSEPERLITSSIGISIPIDSTLHGYLAEYSNTGIDSVKSQEIAKNIAEEMLLTLFSDTKGKNHILSTKSISKSAYGDKEGKWTTVISTAVFIP